MLRLENRGLVCSSGYSLWRLARLHPWLMESMLHESVDVLVPRYSKLVKGGLLDHPVGSGKTVIAAELIGQTLTKGLTVVFVPGHIVKEWEKELRRFVP